MVVKSKAFEDSPHLLLRNPSDAAAEAGIWEGVEGFRNMSSSPESFQNEAFCKKPLTPQKNYYYYFFFEMNRSKKLLHPNFWWI